MFRVADSIVIELYNISWKQSLNYIYIPVYEDIFDDSNPVEKAFIANIMIKKTLRRRKNWSKHCNASSPCASFRSVLLCYSYGYNK